MKKEISIRAIVTICIITLISITSFSQTHTYPIVGTGVTNCYDNSSIFTCPTNTTDPFYGQDQGIMPSYQNNGDGTITDLNTGLMWIQERGTKITWDSAFIMASQCTAGGHNDWRVPTIKELYSLINFNGRSGQTVATCFPYIDTAYFGWTTGDTTLGERVIDAQDWSANQYTGLTMMADTTIFGVNFVDGRIKGYPKYTPPLNTVGQKMYVRYVRGNTLYGINDFLDNGDSTINDNATGLMWAKYDDGIGMNWGSALAYAQTKNTQNYLGHNDWRLPYAKELQSIVDYSRSLDATSSAAIDPFFNCTAITDEGGNTNYPFYWSSTTHLDNMGGVYVAFGEALGWMKMPPTATYYTLKDVHGAGAQRSDPKSGSYTSYYLGVDQSGNPVYGLGPQGDVIRINNYVRLVRTIGSSGINENKTNHSINIYPNPTSDYLTIGVTENATQNADLKIYNCMGQIVYSEKINNQNETKINVSKLQAGIYTIKVTNENGIFTNKFCKK
jgi:hypothetical protein